MYVQVFIFLITLVLNSYLRLKTKQKKRAAAHSGSKWCQNLMMAAPASRIFCLHFCTVWSSRGRSSRLETLAPNDVKITRWQRPYRGYFVFTSVRQQRQVVHLYMYTVWPKQRVTLQPYSSFIALFCKSDMQHLFINVSNTHIFGILRCYIFLVPRNVNG